MPSPPVEPPSHPDEGFWNEWDAPGEPDPEYYSEHDLQEMRDKMRGWK